MKYEFTAIEMGAGVGIEPTCLAYEANELPVLYPTSCNLFILSISVQSILY